MLEWQTWTVARLVLSVAFWAFIVLKVGLLHPRINAHYQSIAEKYEMKGPFLEIGAAPGPLSILAGKYFQGRPDRCAINLKTNKMLDDGSGQQIRFIQANSNNLRNEFADNSFTTVLSNAVIEHDRYFWRSIEEMKRVLAPGGIMAVGAPGYIARKYLNKVELDDSLGDVTITVDVHVPPDYWRFSMAAFKDVICEGMEILELRALRRVPIIVAVAKKPMPGVIPPVYVKTSKKTKKPDDI